MADYIEVPAPAIEDLLQKKGMTRVKQGNEVVYVKKSKVNPSLLLKVYTSIRDGANAVRPSGRDSIKVCVVFDDGTRSFGVGKFPPVFRVHSVQSVLDRLDLRLKEAAQRARDWLAEQAKKTPPPAPAPIIEPEPASEPPQAPPSAPTFEEYAMALHVPF